ncbi:MAG: hypothetical protein ACR2OC_05620 [Solirubrobacterales bacterium]
MGRRRAWIVAAIAVAAVVIVVGGFLGFSALLSSTEDEAREAAIEATEAIEGDGSELAQRLGSSGIEAEGEEAFIGTESEITASAGTVSVNEGGSATVGADGTVLLDLPERAGEAQRELLLFGGDGEETLTLDASLELVDGEDGWSVETVVIDDPFARPPDPDPAELASVGATAEDVAVSALSLLGPDFYEQPDIYATAAEASRQELLAARAANDPSYPPYLVDVPAADLITGPVDRALVLAMGCEYETATATVGDLTAAPSVDAPGHLQVAEFHGPALLEPVNVDCRRGPAPELPLDVDLAVQVARSRLGAESEWLVTRLALQFPDAEARDIYSVGGEILGDERDPAEFVGP